jgi:hypothetical protein
MLTLIAVVASLHAVDVPKTFGTAKLDKAGAKSGIAVLLPQTIPSEAKHPFPDEDAGHGTYELDLGFIKHCHGATACGIAYFTGAKGGSLYGHHKIKLAHGITGRFTPTHCGASCAPPQVDWREHGAVYSVQLKGLRSSQERKLTKRAANSAIRHGDRAH